MEKLDVMEKLEPLRDGLFYRVICRGGEKYQIGAVIDERQPVHTGNLHFVDKTFDTRDEALKRLAEYMVPFMRHGENWSLTSCEPAHFIIEGKATFGDGCELVLPFKYSYSQDARDCVQAVTEYLANETRCQYYGNKGFGS